MCRYIPRRYPAHPLSVSVLDKLGYIAAYEGRTKNKEIEQLIKKRIAEFEQTHGEITTTQQK